MTPSMHLSAIKMAYASRPDTQMFLHDLERAFSLGHTSLALSAPPKSWIDTARKAGEQLEGRIVQTDPKGKVPGDIQPPMGRSFLAAELLRRKLRWCPA